jgi:ABC-type multidrug transport system ATPase subunit
MNIVLTEERPNGSSREVAFDKPLVNVGRDADACDIVFTKEQYPMVSRSHAELRWHEGRWYLVDLNSSYGTFLNGERIVAPFPLTVGGRIQFGQSGPVFRVTSLDTPAAQAVVPAVKAEPGPATPKVQQVAPAVPREARPTVHAPASARLEFVSEPQRKSLSLGGGTIWFGRDTSCDVRFDSAAMVSRRHAQIRFDGGDFIVEDNQSFNGTLVNDQRISAPTPLYDNDRITFGFGGPVLRFDAPSRSVPKGASLPGQRSISLSQLSVAQLDEPGSKTMVFQLDRGAANIQSANGQPQLLMSLTFGGKRELTIGRGESNDIQLDGLQISNKHARLINTDGSVVVDDLGSTNGVYINGSRVSRHAVGPNDSIQIGTFLIRVDASGNVGVFDTRSKTRIDAVNLSQTVKGRFGGGQVVLLDSVSLSIQPNEFIGLLGASGAGKSTLMDALSGVRPAESGNVLVNNLDLYKHFDSLKQSIGYVPQDDVIHRELSVYRALYFIAKLRLSRDVSRAEIDNTINEVLDVVGLSERRSVPINRLSGGQRKRVAIAVELITRPSVIYLDEPTSGLDPATEAKVMKLFRQIAESGRTVIMTTHAMENVRLFDKIVLMMRGRLVFYGPPDEALKQFNAATFADLFQKLEEPIDLEVADASESKRQEITERVAEDWKRKFVATPAYRTNVQKPLEALGQLPQTGLQKRRRLGIFGAFRQWLTLSRRYVEVLLKDKVNLFILFAQAPIIALLTFFVMKHDIPRDFVYFVLSLVAIWFGTSIAAREIIREKVVFRRERMVNLGILPYVGSKLVVLGVIALLQCLLLFVPLKFFDAAGLMSMPGEWFGLPQLWAMLLTAGVGVALGLVVSALVRTSEMATSLVPLILIPQILFSGLVGVPTGVSKVVGLTMPAAWSFDTMKRFSTLDTLEPEGAEPKGKTNGLGLYKYIETENDKIVTDARKGIADYQKDAEDKFRQYDAQVRNGETPAIPRPMEPPAIPAPKKIPDDLSGFVVFLNPWMNEVLNQVVLMLMFGILVVFVLIILRLQDV